MFFPSFQEVEAGGARRNDGGGRSKSTGFLCAKRSGRKKRRKGLPGGPGDEGGPGSEDAPETIAYEEVALYYPRSDRKRPVVLIGPPNIGRHELRQRLMQDGDRFAAAIPRKRKRDHRTVLACLLGATPPCDLVYLGECLALSWAFRGKGGVADGSVAYPT